MVGGILYHIYILATRGTKTSELIEPNAEQQESHPTFISAFRDVFSLPNGQQESTSLVAAMVRLHFEFDEQIFK